MSYILNDPAAFADELAAGFVAANQGSVRGVAGGVARASAPVEGQVAVVVGGRSRHYPAFAGLVGAGLAHGAAPGNVFASPSAHRIRSVAKSVAAGAGVLLSYGNYAGDVLNFDLAQKRLAGEGIACRTVTVTDDIYSASSVERFKRRGVAGDLAVFKAAAWAAKQDYSLDEVAAIASRANDRTRTFGVAFSGCTLAGAHEPLFTVPEGRMAVGLGNHGEPGIDARPIPSARELATLFVESLLEEKVADTEPVPAASSEAVTAGQTVDAVIIAIRDMIDRNVDEFGRLDAIAGDGDHGIGMQRGARAAAAVVATDAAHATADLVPRIGRARPHGEKSRGTPDPGAISFALAMTTAGRVLAQDTNSKEK